MATLMPAPIDQRALASFQDTDTHGPREPEVRCATSQVAADERDDHVRGRLRREHRLDHPNRFAPTIARISWRKKTRTENPPVLHLGR